MKTLQKYERFLRMKRFAILIALSILQTHFVQAQQPRPDVAVRTALSNLKHTFTGATDNSPLKTFLNNAIATAVGEFKKFNEFICSGATIQEHEKEKGPRPYGERALAGVTVGGVVGLVSPNISLILTIPAAGLQFLCSASRLNETGDSDKYNAGRLLFGGALVGLLAGNRIGNGVKKLFLK